MKTLVRTACLTLLPVACLVATAAAQDAALAAAVNSYDPELQLPGDGGLVQWADFTGDGRPDVAAVLGGSGSTSLVIFNATAGGFQPHPLYTDLPAGSVVLRTVLPGWHRILGPKGSVELTSPAVELVFPGRSSVIYAWQDGRYRVYPTENYY